MNTRPGPVRDAHRGIELPLVVGLDDGTPLRLRLGTPDDGDALVAGFARLSEASRFARFFTGINRLSDLDVDRLLEIDESRHVAVVAEDTSRISDVDEQTIGLGVGVGRYATSNADPTRAEIAVAVVKHELSGLVVVHHVPRGGKIASRSRRWMRRRAARARSRHL